MFVLKLKFSTYTAVYGVYVLLLCVYLQLLDVCASYHYLRFQRLIFQFSGIMASKAAALSCQVYYKACHLMIVIIDEYN